MSNILSRRRFLQVSTSYPLTAIPVGSALGGASPPTGSGQEYVGAISATDRQAAMRGLLKKLVCTRQEVDLFLDPTQPNWAKFDPELGYTLRNSILKDGVDGCRTITTIEKTGERRMINYAGRPCRVNTYGDSFTQGAQTSDGETWQECLAAHLGEPIRNFGIGGHGVYQAYRRMLREEATPSGAQYIMLNIWGVDDHLRSVDAWRWIRVELQDNFLEWWKNYPGHLHMFQGNPWAHIRLDLKTGEPVERGNVFSTPASLYNLCDAEFVYTHFKDDLVVKLLLAEHDGSAADLEELEGLAASLGIRADFSSVAAVSTTAKAVHLEYALRAGKHIVQIAQAFSKETQKELLVLLSYDSDTIARACKGEARPDQSLVDFLKEKKINFVDVLTKHVEDFHSFNLSPEKYVERYYIGHYKPQGNHFFAFAIKDAVVNWLDPKPIAYREGSETIPVKVP